MIPFSKFFRNALSLFLCVILISPNVFAAQSVSDSETAGAEQSRFEQEMVLEEQARIEEEKVEQPAVLKEEVEEKKELESEVSFVLKEVIITGNVSIATETLQAIADTRLNTEVTLEDLRTLAGEIKQYYRDAGYIAAYVYLPPQNVTRGTVEITVVEGILGDVKIEGNKWYSEKVIRRILNLTVGNVVFYKNLRSALLFLNKSEDIDAKAVLRPGEKPQTTDLVVNIEDRLPVHLSTDVNNLGTDNTGRHRWGVALSHNNLFGQMDRLLTRFQLGSGLWAFGADYSVPINSKRTLVGVNYSHSEVDVGGPFKALDVEGKATTYGLYILQPFLHGGPVEASFQVGFDWKSVENKILGQVSGEDELRILNLGLNTEMTDRWGRTMSPHSFHFGFSSFLGASSKIASMPTRPLTGGQFFIYRGSVIRYNRLPFGMLLSIRGVVQLSPDRLPPSEQIRLGGAFSVRGYPEGEYLADSGAYMANEILIPTYLFPKDWKLPFSKQPLRQQIQEVVFFDFGGGELDRPLAGEEEDKFLAGMGAGLRIHLFDRVYARLHWAGRLGSKSRDGSDSQFYFGVSAEVL